MMDQEFKTELREQIHDALDSYTIHVNSEVNETRTLPEWVQYLVAASHETRELTKELRDKEEMRKARHKLVEALSHSAIGRFFVGLWGMVKNGAGWAAGSALVYALWKWIAPIVAGWFQ